MKPADFLIGLLEFFAVLLPGTIATWLVVQYLPVQAQNAFVSWAREPTTLQWVLSALTSYGLGQFVFMGGSKLDSTVYDPWRKRTKSGPGDVTYKAADALRKKLTTQLSGGRFSTFKWARAYVGIHSPEARLEIERTEANSKLFRSLVVIAAVLVLHFLLEGSITYGIAAAVVCWLSLARYCEARWNAMELTYATAVIIHHSKRAGAKQSADEG